MTGTLPQTFQFLCVSSFLLRCPLGWHLQFFPDYPAHVVIEHILAEHLLCDRYCSKCRGITHLASGPVLFHRSISHSVELFCSFARLQFIFCHLH